MNPQPVLSLTDLSASTLSAAVFSTPMIVFLGAILLTFALISLMMFREKHSFDT